MASRQRRSGSRSSSRNSDNGGDEPKRRSRKQKQDYDETPDYGSAFYRDGNEPPQPKYTGTGLLDAETLEAIQEADGEFQIAIWPKRSKQGLKYLRVHIEPPWEGDDDDDVDDDEEDEDVPF